jgi:AraC-like DNA-binding protein
MNIVASWLESMFVQAKVESFIPQVTNLLYTTDEISVKEIADSIGRSQQHIARVFNKYTGVNPKKLQRIFRFQKVLKTLGSVKNELLTSTAHHNNYFDQPHFNNEIRSLSGYTPSQISKQKVLETLRVIR